MFRKMKLHPCSSCNFNKTFTTVTKQVMCLNKYLGITSQLTLGTWVCLLEVLYKPLNSKSNVFIEAPEGVLQHRNVVSSCILRGCALLYVGWHLPSF